MVDFYPVHMPEDSSPGHCLATFSTTITAMAIELGTYFDNQMRPKFGDYWFQDLCEERQRTDPLYKYKSHFDFSWIINEPYRNATSPIRDLLPKNEYQFYPALKSLLETRNRWYHDFNPHTLAELRKALNIAKYIAEKCGLSLAQDLVLIGARVNEISAGTYPTNKSKVDSPPPVAEEPEQTSDIRQSAVGAAWLGPLGQRKLQLNKSGSIIDLGAAKNVTTELGSLESSRYFQLWRALELDWLWVDSGGAVAANVLGSLRMVGYWGTNPEDAEQDPFAKFLLPRSYAFEAGKLVDLESKQSIDETTIGPVSKSTLARGKTSIPEGDIVRATWDGDLIYFGDQGPEYIGEVESEDWFLGHFFMPTSKD